MNTPLSDEIAEELRELVLDVLAEASKVAGKEIYITLFPELKIAENVLNLIAYKMPEKVEPSDKDFSLDGGIKPTYDKDGELVDMGRPPMKHKMTRPYNDGWNAYHDTFKSILKGGMDE
jgi:hypothetical protein